MAEFTFKLKSDSKEYPARFGGQEITLTLPETLDGVREMVEPGADTDAVLLGLITGQGLRLSKQKKVKDFLASDAAKEMDVPTALAEARRAAEEMKLGAPRKTGGGGKKSARVAEAEAKAENATAAVRDTYLAVPAPVRRTLRPSLVDRFGEDVVAGWEAAAK